MISVLAHLTSLAFVTWTAYCLFRLIGTYPDTPGRDKLALIWWVLAMLTGLFFLLK